MAKDNWVVKREPEDLLAKRLSIGSPHGGSIQDDGYIVYRGDTAECIKLLEIALAKFKQYYKEQGE